jgi:hypothetical protein
LRCGESEVEMKRLYLAMLVLLCLLAAGCNGGDEAEPEEATPEAEETTEAAEREKISISGNEYSFDLPDTLTGGFVDIEFKNEGRLVHEAAFIEVDPEMAQDQFIKDLKTASGEEVGPIAAYIKPYAGGFFTKGGETQTVSQSLPGGTYYVVCTLTDRDSVEGEEGENEEEAPPLPQHFEQGQIKKVTVQGPETVEAPDSEAVVAAKEYTFDITGLKAGNNEMLFRNDGPNELHMAAVLEFPEGVDEAAAERAIQAFSSGGPPPEGTPEPADVGFSGVFQPGAAALFDVEAKSGRVYAFVCFIQDRAGGPPHTAKGMTKLVKVA